MAESLTVVIEGGEEGVSLGALFKSIEDIRRLVRDIDNAVMQRRAGRVWIVSEIHSSSPTLVLHPAEDGAESIDAIASGLRILTTQDIAEPPPKFSLDALDDLLEMDRLFKGRERVRNLTFSANGSGRAVIDASIVRHVEHVMRGGYSAYGSLEGRLDAVNLHRGIRITIWDRVSGLPIRCLVPNTPAWASRVKSLLQRPVLVVGEVEYFRNGQPRQMKAVTEIRDRTYDPTQPRGDFGTVPDITGGVDSVEYVRALRS